MNLDEAIEHCKEKENCSQCGQEHKQLREWLEELKDLRSQYNLPLIVRLNFQNGLTNLNVRRKPNDLYYTAVLVRRDRDGAG